MRYIAAAVVTLVLAGCESTGPRSLVAGTAADTKRVDELVLPARIRMLSGPAGLVSWKMAADGSRAVASNALVRRTAYPVRLAPDDYPADWLNRYDRVELVYAREKSRFGAVKDLSMSFCGKDIPLAPSSVDPVNSRINWPSAAEQVVVGVDLAAFRAKPPHGCEPAFVYRIELAPADRPVEARLSSLKVHFLPKE
jgi:hypothetical protein